MRSVLRDGETGQRHHNRRRGVHLRRVALLLATALLAGVTLDRPAVTRAIGTAPVAQTFTLQRASLLSACTTTISGMVNQVGLFSVTVGSTRVMVGGTTVFGGGLTGILGLKPGQSVTICATSHLGVLFAGSITLKSSPGGTCTPSTAPTCPSPPPTTTPELGSAELVTVGLVPLAGFLLYRRRRRDAPRGERNRA